MHRLPISPAIPVYQRMAIAVAIGVLTTGCSTTNVGLKYAAPATVTSTPPNSPGVSVGSFIDKRGEPATWLGAIRGGYGNPLKNLQSDEPVAILVASAFTDGLRARRYSEASALGQMQITGVVKKLDCNQLVRREANVEIEVTVTDMASKRQVFSRSYSANNVEGSLLGPSGVFGSVEGLRAITERTLREVVDQALDDSAFVNSFRASSPITYQAADTGTPVSPTQLQTKEDRLRELKRLHDAKLISDDVYTYRQKVILSEG